MKKVQRQCFSLLLVFFYSFFLLPITTLNAENTSRPLPGTPFSPIVQHPSSVLMLSEAQNATDPLVKDQILINKKRPFSLKTRPAIKKPWYKKWWVWTIAAAVVGGIVAANGDSKDGSGSSAGSPGGTVIITGAIPSP